MDDRDSPEDVDPHAWTPALDEDLRAVLEAEDAPNDEELFWGEVQARGLYYDEDADEWLDPEEETR